MSNTNPKYEYQGASEAGVASPGFGPLGLFFDPGLRPLGAPVGPLRFRLCGDRVRNRSFVRI